VLFRRLPRSPEPGPKLKRVAVLPFENLGSPEDDYFADGMADAVRGKLTSLRGVEVIARSSSVGYKKTSKTPRQIADELGVPYLLTATVRWQKGGGSSRVQVSPELIQVKESGAPASRWQEPFDAALTDVFEVQAGIATQVAQALGVALATDDEKQLSTKPTLNLAAYDMFLKGLENEHRFYSKEARLAFSRALELDPSFAMAMLGLARHTDDDNQRVALLKRAAKEKDRLTELERLKVEMALSFEEKRVDDGANIASEIHNKFPADTQSAMVLATKEIRNGNSDRAIKIFEELLSIDPNNAEAYNQIGYLYGWRGEYEKAAEAFKRYQLLEPDTPNPYDSLGEVQAYSGRYDEAIENLNRALAIKPDFVDSYVHLAVAYEGIGEYTKSVDAYLKAAELVEQVDLRRQYYFMALRAACESEDSARLEEIHARLVKLPPGSKYGELHKAIADAALDVCAGNPAAAMPKLAFVTTKLEEFAAKEPKSESYPQPRQDGGVLLLTAQALEKQGKTDEAFALWKKVAEPPTPYVSFVERRLIYEARAHMAEVLARKGDLERAEKLLTENRKWNPNWAPTRPQELEIERLRKEKPHTAAR
jgi:TolB-like protein/Flp pilus assembly protein TadD